MIEDDASVQDILRQMLLAKGHQVVLASDGEKGIEEFKAHPFDLVLTDLGMPKISGCEVGKVIKDLNPNVPTVMITGWGVEVDRQKMQASGIDRIISKPFTFEEVSQIVSEAMERTGK